jgi:Mg/Co/Ni transporter MgtE
LGAAEVYDYVGSKADWQSAGLPMEPSVIDDRHVIGIAHTDVPRCGLDESIGDVVARLSDSPYETCAVVNERTVLLGAVHAGSLAPDSQDTVADVMEEGPQTVRVDEEVRSLAQRMDESLDQVFVTDPDGRLLGLVTWADVQAASVHSGA